MEVFLFVVMLGELAGEPRRGIVAGVLLALGASTGLGEAQTLIGIILTLISALAAVLDQGTKGTISLGIMIMCIFPTIAGAGVGPLWMRWVPTLSWPLSLVLWLIALRTGREEVQPAQPWPYQ